jgi:hypothetical protein
MEGLMNRKPNINIGIFNKKAAMKGCWLLGCFFLVYGLSCGQSQSAAGSPRSRPVSSESAYLINSQPQPTAGRWSQIHKHIPATPALG